MKKNILIMNAYLMFVITLSILVVGIAVYVNSISTSNNNYQNDKIEKKIEEGFEEVKYSFLDIEEVVFDNLEDVVERNISTVKIKIYPLSSPVDHELKVEIYNKDVNIYSYRSYGAAPEIIAFEYKNYTYIIISEYSGGAHCCLNYSIFSLDQNNNLKLIEELSLGNSGISQNSFIVKNGKLYLRISDDRFSYFHTSFAGSYFFNQYYLIGEGEIKKDNSDFKEEYIQEAIKCQTDLENSVEKLDKINIESDFEAWFPSLVCITTNYILAGDQEKAWNKIDQLYVQDSRNNFDGSEAPEIEEIKIEFKVAMDEFLEKPEKPFIGSDDIILYIEEGDLWQSNINGEMNVKLIDNDTISKVDLSVNKENIAYTIRNNIQEVVTTYEGKKEERDFVIYDLLIADKRGSNSYLVKSGVSNWGWIPSTDLLWYETSALGQWFDWDYFGQNDIWVFNLKSKKSKNVISERQMLNPKWSPDGKTVTYVGYNSDDGYDYQKLVLVVINRDNLEKKEIFDIPYVGGDRGGPPPIPSFYWDNDSEFIYTVFTPIIWEGDDKFKERFKSGHLSGWKIPIDGSEPVKIIPDTPSRGLNDETYPQVVFNEDFSKVVYTRYNDEDIKNLEPSEWFHNNESIPLALVVYDINSKKETTLIENIYSKEGLNKFWYYPQGGNNKELFFNDDQLYIFTGQRRDLEDEYVLLVKKINIFTGESKKFEILLNAKISDRHKLSDVGYFNESEIINFSLDDKLIYYFEEQKLSETIIEKAEFMKIY